MLITFSKDLILYCKNGAITRFANSVEIVVVFKILLRDLQGLFTFKSMKEKVCIVILNWVLTENVPNKIYICWIFCVYRTCMRGNTG